MQVRFPRLLPDAFHHGGGFGDIQGCIVFGERWRSMPQRRPRDIEARLPFEFEGAEMPQLV